MACIPVYQIAATSLAGIMTCELWRHQPVSGLRVTLEKVERGGAD